MEASPADTAVAMSLTGRRPTPARTRRPGRTGARSRLPRGTRPENPARL